jgi:hypothetical protein
VQSCHVIVQHYALFAGFQSSGNAFRIPRKVAHN